MSIFMENWSTIIDSCPWTFKIETIPNFTSAKL